jgi:hypothetical protein
MEEWIKGQQNVCLFVMVDAVGAEVLGLGTAFTVKVSKGGAAFATGAGVKAEVGLGWYKYTATAGEASTAGPVALAVTGAGCVQQNLDYLVKDSSDLDAIAEAVWTADTRSLNRAFAAGCSSF